MLYADASLHRIRAFAIQHGLTGQGFAAMAGLSEGTVRRLHTPTFNPHLATLRALESVIPADFMPISQRKRRGRTLLAAE